eukprot:763395-Hanusia_phi.AAC.11
MERRAEVEEGRGRGLSLRGRVAMDSMANDGADPQQHVSYTSGQRKAKAARSVRMKEVEREEKREEEGEEKEQWKRTEGGAV